MTINEIKRDLPQVRVRIGRKVLWARVTGRLNPQATVTVFADSKEYLRGPYFVDFHFSWEAIERALRLDLPLRT
jgi:hypothetical protein